MALKKRHGCGPDWIVGLVLPVVVDYLVILFDYNTVYKYSVEIEFLLLNHSTTIFALQKENFRWMKLF
ncbi:MAG TPA: hypothetical protein DCE41_05170 [Cytophagales bacterium]|nr:hypothetical protein [Cytophagales bacterium]